MTLALDQRANDAATDATEPVDGDLGGHWAAQISAGSVPGQPLLRHKNGSGGARVSPRAAARSAVGPVSARRGLRGRASEDARH